MVEAGVNADLFTNKLSRTIVADGSRIIDLDINFVVSYALSSIGRGMNLPEFKIAWADMASHKPTCAYSTDDLKTLMVEMFDQQLSTVIQNIGRIFRTEEGEDDGVRVVVVENLNTISSDVRKEFAVVLVHIMLICAMPLRSRLKNSRNGLYRRLSLMATCLKV